MLVPEKLNDNYQKKWFFSTVLNHMHFDLYTKSVGSLERLSEVTHHKQFLTIGHN
jgi:hypothetical protein